MSLATFRLSLRLRRSMRLDKNCKDPKRFLWIFAAMVPLLVHLSWLLAVLTELAIFWWTVPIVIFIVIPIADKLGKGDKENLPDFMLERLKDVRYYRWLTFLYLPNQYLALVFASWCWAGGGWVILAFEDSLGLMISVGTVGGIGINAAHELGHKLPRLEVRLSKIALAQSCYGHFYVEHNRGHHVKVATPDDPASALMGQTVYGFVPNSVLGGLRSAWQLERARLRTRNHRFWSPRNNILNAWSLSVALFVILTVWFGIEILPWLVGQAVIGICLLEVVNYLEHYGLRRQRLQNGRYEAVRPVHSWNGSSGVSNIFLFHLQRHSDHHANPRRRYQVLRHQEEAPQLPMGYAGMIVLALVPPLWRRVMDPRVLRHYNGNIALAAVKPSRGNGIWARNIQELASRHNSKSYRRPTGDR